MFGNSFNFAPSACSQRIYALPARLAPARNRTTVAPSGMSGGRPCFSPKHVPAVSGRQGTYQGLRRVAEPRFGSMENSSGKHPSDPLWDPELTRVGPLALAEVWACFRLDQRRDSPDLRERKDNSICSDWNYNDQHSQAPHRYLLDRNVKCLARCFDLVFLILNTTYLFPVCIR